MANLKLPNIFSFIFLIFSIFTIFAHSTPVNIPLSSVSDLLIQSALDSMNDNSPTRHTYKSGNLISAQKLVEPPYVIYRLTLNLESNCIDESSCPRQACAIDLRQHENGVIDVQINSIQCMDLHPQSDQAEMQQQNVQEVSQDDSNSLDQDTTMESLDKRLSNSSNSSLQLDHEVQTVADGSDRPFIAVRAIDRNYCAGCPYELDPKLPGLAAYGEEVVQSMDDAGRSDFKHKVINIVKVTRAVPVGSNVVVYELLLEIGETNCHRIGTNPRSDCSLLPNVPTKLCLVTFKQRPWQQDSRKIVSNNCTELPESYNKVVDNLEETLVTSDNPYTSETSPGLGKQEATLENVNDNGEIISKEKSNKFSGSLASSIDEFFDNMDTTFTTGRIDPEEAEQNPVTEETLKKIVIERKGDDTKAREFQDKYKEFDDFLEKINFDLPIKVRDPEPVDRGTPVNEEIIQPEIVVRTNSDSNSALKRTRRSIFSTPDNEEELVKKLAQKAVDELDDIDVDNKKRILLNVIESKKRPGNDKTYYITMTVAKTNCIEGTTDCSENNREETKICKAQIHVNDSSMSETAKVLQTQCFDEARIHDERSKRQLLNAITWEKVDDPRIREYAEKGLRKYSQLSNRENEPFLVDILEATSQIVAGTMYRIKVRFGESTCPKGTTENCQLRTGSPNEDYLITVFSQPWKDNGKPHIKIEPLVEKKFNRVRRSEQLVGAPEPNRLDDKQIQEYTKKGLEKYSETFNVDNEPWLIKVVKTSSQVVSGMLHKITVELGESTCPKGVKENCQLKSESPVSNYEITVWSQPWVDHGNPDIKIKLLSKDKSVSKRSLRGQNYSAKNIQLAKRIENERAFERFIKEHDKTYESQEVKNYRFEVFLSNLKTIEELKNGEQGTAEYGPTIFADLTPEEFKARHLGLRSDLQSENNIPMRMADIPDIELPKEFDWRHQNAVTEVKNQGSCGSCWAFSVTGNIEGQYAIKHGQLLSLSEQELVDCDKLDDGCNGGLPDNAYRAIEQLGGLELENDYPYDARDEKCHFNKEKVRVNVVEGLNITANETGMAQWLVQNGPISIGINANAMQFYMGGVSHPFKFRCNADNLDHGVLIVGYGIHTYPIFKKKMPYWIIKNSWGPRWGEQGYYRVYRGDGTCGVNKMVTSAVIA